MCRPSSWCRQRMVWWRQTNQAVHPAFWWTPRNGNRLQLIRSVNGVGDYSVPTGAYSLRQDELLRVDSFGKPIGVVRR